MKIVHAPNSVLAEKAKPVTIRPGNEKIERSILNLIEEMKQTLTSAIDPEGVGLAAPQVGKSLQIFITKPTVKSPIQTFINPQILELKEKSAEQKEKRGNEPTQLEGCLSLPEIWGDVCRYSELIISYYDENGEHHKRKFTGFPATIIQHEMDHLNGTLFPKRVLEQKGKLYKSSKDKKGEYVFEELEI